MATLDYQTVAEVAITIVGFSGIVALFTDRLGIRDNPQNRLSFIDLLSAGFGAVFLSFLPTALGNFIGDEEILWRVSDISMAMWFLGSLVLLFLVGKGTKPESRLIVILPVLALSLAVSLFLSGIGLLSLNMGSLYFVGLLFLLAMSAMQFCVLILKSL